MKLVEDTAHAPFLDVLRRHPDFLLAAGILSILFVILMPLPPALVDPLLILNLTLSVVILLTAACVSRPLDFSVFPSLLLVITFFRLALNIATTRLILGNGAEGPLAAGQVVRAFGEFVAADNPIIGLIIFMVIVLVQFVVITKGATRVSEVAARFQLDAMPGKQLSIDGDLAAGFIDQSTARARRQVVSQEADFYGAMDGASKFVRGDAVASLVIVLINIGGGIAIGVLYHDFSAAYAVDVFSRLTIGDGLVSQVPALMVSIAAALLVTRNAASEHLGKDLSGQILANDRVLFVAAAFLLLLLPSGLPVFALLVGAAACGFAGYAVRRERKRRLPLSVPEDESEEEEPDVTPTRDVRSLLAVEPLAIEVGYRLLPLVDEARGGDLLRRIATVRERIAAELGFVVPAVQVRDSRRIAPSEYSFKLRGDSLGQWNVDPCGFLAVPRRLGPAPLEGRPGPELEGASTFWVADVADMDAVETSYVFLQPSRAVARHLEAVVRSHAAELLSREEVSRMLTELRDRAPSLVDDVVPEALRVSDLHQVLQELLREGVSIRDLETILEALGGTSDRSFSLERAVAEVRRKLSRNVCSPATGEDGKLHVVLLDPALEEFLLGSTEVVDGATTLNVDPQTMESFCERATEVIAALQREDLRPAVLCSPKIRHQFWRALAGRVPRVPVLSYDEVFDEKLVEVHGTINLDTPRRQSGVNKEVHRSDV